MRTLVYVLFLAGACIFTGCMSAAKLTQVTDDGGVVTYPLKRDRESIYSSDRADALKLIEAHCHGSYRIVKEGETQGVTRNSGLDADDLVTTRRYWGLKFQCK